ncbi:COP9 signalosome [Pelagophyceae sp. CCMP2097]|nr:COP9 signalosome [Pelagophyceae sp. CCMP2097]|mmetsp:Transcript_7630/g.24889  ORF Transcript_7630/g.24889 Transcript_7630/m.24889 type:complete len:191 (+) Transcript_7630:75-647(+)
MAAMEVVSQNDTFADRAFAAEQAELAAAGDAGDATRLLLLYLILGRLEDARHLWRRTPDDARAAAPQLAAAWGVGRRLWRRDDVPGALALLAQTAWEEPLVDLAGALATSVRGRELDVMSKAFSNISLKTVAATLHLADEQAHGLCMQRGWGFDAATSTFAPKPPVQEMPRFDGFAQLEHLTDIVTSLQM